MMDNLADIKLKLTCTNSIVAMIIIHMEQIKYHRATEQRVDCSVKMKRMMMSFSTVYSVESIRSMRAYIQRDGWKDG